MRVSAVAMGRRLVHDQMMRDHPALTLIAGAQATARKRIGRSALAPDRGRPAAPAANRPVEQGPFHKSGISVAEH